MEKPQKLKLERFTFFGKDGQSLYPAHIEVKLRDLQKELEGQIEALNIAYEFIFTSQKRVEYLKHIDAKGKLSGEQKEEKQMLIVAIGSIQQKIKTSNIQSAIEITYQEIVTLIRHSQQEPQIICNQRSP